MGRDSAPGRRRAIAKAHGWYCFNATIEREREALHVIATDQERDERPAELGPLEITMTPMGPFGRGVADQYEALGVDRLVLLPDPDAPAGRRREPVPVDDILRTIDRTTNMI